MRTRGLAGGGYLRAMSSPAQVVRGARLPALPAPLAMIAGALSVQLGGAVAVHAFTRATPLGVTFMRSLFATAILVAAVRIAAAHARGLARGAAVRHS